jgi:hypothetical protein
MTFVHLSTTGVLSNKPRDCTQSQKLFIRTKFSNSNSINTYVALQISLPLESQVFSTVPKILQMENKLGKTPLLVEKGRNI